MKQFTVGPDGFINMMLNGRDAQLQFRLNRPHHRKHQTTQKSRIQSLKSRLHRSISFTTARWFNKPSRTGFCSSSNSSTTTTCFLPTHFCSNLQIDPPSHAPVQVGNLRLPKLELPLFYGDPETFQAFWDIYESVVHSQNFATVQKFAFGKVLI